MFKKISNQIDHYLSQEELVAIIKKFDQVFSKLPNLPDFLPKFLLTISPWLALISGIVGIIAGPIMALLGLLSLVTLSPFIILSYISSALIMILNTFLMFKAFKPLKKKSLQGWLYVFWSEILWLINGAIEILGGEQQLIPLVISTLIGFYLLFEMKRIINQKGNSKRGRIKDNLRGGKRSPQKADVVG